MSAELHNSPLQTNGNRTEDFARQEALYAQAKALGILPHEYDVFVRNDFPLDQIPEDRARRVAIMKYMIKNETPPPKWMTSSGLFPDEKLDQKVRRDRVRIVYKIAVAIIRHELKRHEIDPEKDERTIFWDPVAEVCQRMEIAPSKLSAFCKELTGITLIHTIDRIKAEMVKKKMRAEIKEFVARFLVSGGSKVTGLQGCRVTGSEAAGEKSKGSGDGKNTTRSVVPHCDRWAVWKALKAERRWPDFSQNQWAQAMGFATYRRLYRACQVVFGLTPHQMEMAFIQECLDAGTEREKKVEPGTGTRGVGSGPEFAELSMAEIEAAVMGIRREEWRCLEGKLVE